MFGLVDLTTPFVGPASFGPAYLLETGWGLLYTVLLGVPTAALVLGPDRREPATQLVVVAAALAVMAVVTPELGHLVPAVVAGALGLGAGRLGRGRRRDGRLGGRGSSRAMAALRSAPLPSVLAAVAVVPAVAYAVSAVVAARAAVVTDETNGLDHWPAQGAFALGAVASAALSVVMPGSRVPPWTAGATAVWFGALSVAYPGHAGSAGTAGGAVAIAWGIAFLLARERARPSAGQPTR